MTADLSKLNRLDLAETVYELLRDAQCNTGDAREVLALVALRLQEREARATL